MTKLPWFIGATLSALPGAAVWAQQYSHGDPTPQEQYVLEMINRARANPDAEGARLGIDIREGLTAAEAANVGPRPPLAMNPNLLAAARAHSQDMWTRNYFAHDTLAPPNQTWYERITAFGYDYTGGKVGENIAASSNASAAYLEDLLMIDEGVAGRGHRKNLLDIYSTPQPPFREIGVGYYHNNTANGSGFRDFLTQDFGRNSSGPFLVGVVYNDLNGNNFYDVGEGLAGVTVTQTSSGYYAVTSTSGGYAIPYTGTSGPITVTATGGPLGSITLTKTLTRTGENLKADLTLQDLPIVSIAATDSSASESGPDPGTFTVTRTGGTTTHLTVYYTVGGTASAGADYVSLPGSVIIPAGSATATITVTPLQDTLVEGSENVIVTITSGSGYLIGSPAGAAVNTADDDSALPGDADGDGLSDTEEAAAGTNPSDPDTDNDGMPDGAEVAHGYDPLNADQDGNGRIDGQDDWDGDGINNQTETYNETYPGDAPPPPEEDERGRCGSLGLDLLGPLGGLWLFRRRPHRECA